MTKTQYEQNEFAAYQRQMKQIDSQPTADKREAQADYAAHLADPDWLASSVGLILDQNYGYWVGKRALEIVQNKRMNRCAWFGTQVALLDHGCPQRHAAKAWHSLDAVQSVQATAAIQGAIDNHIESLASERQD